MDGLIIRDATANDISFIVETIIEAEKAGTNVSPYSTIFGLTKEETENYITKLLFEEIDGCELSISSYLVAEKNNKLIASVSAWVEGIEGMPSSIIKGNLLSFILPRKCIERAAKLKEITHELHIEYMPNTIQIGAGYVSKDYRGNNLLGLLISEKIKRLVQKHPGISEVYDHMYSCNIPAIRTDEKLKFKIVNIKESLNKEILNYLPYNKKILMKKNIH